MWRHLHLFSLIIPYFLPKKYPQTYNPLIATSVRERGNRICRQILNLSSQYRQHVSIIQRYTRNPRLKITLQHFNQFFQNRPTISTFFSFNVSHSILSRKKPKILNLPSLHEKEEEEEEEEGGKKTIVPDGVRCRDKFRDSLITAARGPCARFLARRAGRISIAVN